MQRPAELTAPGLSFPHTHTTKIEQCHSAGRRHAHAPRFRSANVSCLARARCKGVAPWMSARDLIEVVRVAVIVVHDQGRPSVRGGHPPARVDLTASCLSRPLCRLPKGPCELARFARGWYVSETLWYQNFISKTERKLASCTVTRSCSTDKPACADDPADLWTRCGTRDAGAVRRMPPAGARARAGAADAMIL